MRRPLRIGDRAPAADAFGSSGRRGAGTLTTGHQLLTSVWTADVEALERAIDRFTADRPLGNDCRVDLFEMPGDSRLHVNVTHTHPTVAESGWAGPGRLADGFVHNRRFGRTPPGRIVRNIRAMVFAARTNVNAASRHEDQRSV